MFEWKVEEMKLLNDKMIEIDDDEHIISEYIFSVEPYVTREDKIYFVDRLYDGLLSYLIDLMKKFDKVKDKIKKDSKFDEFYDQESLDNWLKENDKKEIIQDIGRVKFFYSERFINRDLLNSKGDDDIYDDIVDEYFHQALGICCAKEREYAEKLSAN